MPKALVVAASEFSSFVRTRAFLVSVLLLPLLMFGVGAMQHALEKRVDTTPRHFAVLDHSGSLYTPIAEKAVLWNAKAAPAGTAPVGPRFEPDQVTAGSRAPDELRLELSERVRRGDLYAFVEIPARALDPEAEAEGRVLYYSDNPTNDDLRRWLGEVLNDEIRSRRYSGAGVNPALVARLERRVRTENLGLFERGADGRIRPAEKVDEIKTQVLPIIFMMLLFLPVMTGAPHLLNSVIEEKMSRISEVLLGAVTPFELMMGKLLGSVAVSILLALLYVGGGLLLAGRFGYAGAVPPMLFACFLLFLVLAMLFFGSLYIAVGAACNELKDAQSLMMPILLLTMLPMFTFTAVMRSPASSFSVGMSLFPPSAPFLMLLRMGMHPSPPAWQVGLSIVLLGAATLGCVFAAGRIFRVGVLSQGKSASFGQMLRWLLAG